MRNTPIIERSATVQILAGIALVLFCLTLLRFVTLTFAEDTPRQAPLLETSEADVVFFLDQDRLNAQHDGAVLPMRIPRCGTGLMRVRQRQRQETTVQRELKLRAAQSHEVDEALHSRLGLGGETAQSPIMR